MPKRSKIWLYRIAEALGPWLIPALGLTLRIKRVNSDEVDRFLKEKKPALLCTWHGRMYLPVFYHRYSHIVAMISQHGDGEMIAKIVKKLGYGSVRGSSTRGGKKAFVELLAHLKNGGIGAMLPDGPRGPRHHLKYGTLFLSSKAQCPIIPITFAAVSCWRFGSWDRMVIPKPFSRCVLVYGDAMQVPAEIPEDKVEEERLKIETAMIDLVKQAEALLGRGDEAV
ncbi:MAG: lysophospholipid acyltransferase family protein [bacterium]